MKPFEIWLAKLPHLKKSRIIGGRRPVVVVSDDDEAVVTVVPLSSQTGKPQRIAYVYLRSPGLDSDSIALCDRVMPLDRSRLVRRIGFVVDPFEQAAVRRALALRLLP